jgi:hypothetical protein
MIDYEFYINHVRLRHDFTEPYLEWSNDMFNNLRHDND